MRLSNYTYDDFFSILKDPSNYVKFLNDLNVSIQNNILSLIYDRGVDVMNEDWDNLIILDACRYDAFDEINTISGKLEGRISRAAISETFMYENFVGRELHDTVYVTANPYVNVIGSDVFHAVISVLDQWSSEKQTVLPETVTKAAQEAARKYPNKRLIIHYMQPHQPYIGPKGEQIQNEIEKYFESRGWPDGINYAYTSKDDSKKELDGLKQIEAAKYDELEVTRDDIRQAYDENLKIVLEDVESLLSELTGKTVITADHGELLGERPYKLSKREYGHPAGVYAPEVRKVPWLIIESDKRRSIRSNPPVRYKCADENTIDEKLSALGYK